MIYATPQGEHAHSELQHEIKQAKSAKWYRRLKIIQLSLSGASVSQLSDQFDLCPATIRSYIKAYNGRLLLDSKELSFPDDQFVV